MSDQDVQELIRYRLEQAETALEDAKFLLAGKRSSPSIVARLSGRGAGGQQGEEK